MTPSNPQTPREGTGIRQRVSHKPAPLGLADAIANRIRLGWQARQDVADYVNRMARGGLVEKTAVWAVESEPGPLAWRSEQRVSATGPRVPA